MVICLVVPSKMGGGAEGRRERLLHRAAHRHSRSIPLARDAHKTAITAQHSVLLVRRRRPIDHPPGGPCSYGHVDGMGLGRVGDATPAAAVVDWRAVGWARECGGEIVIGPGINTSGWTSGVLVIAVVAGC
jgi:hypothetical protein